MKKLLFISTFMLCTSIAFAEFNFGVKAGYTSSIGIGNFKEDINGYNMGSIKNDIANGFHAGVLFRMGKRVYFQPELLYNMQKNDYQFTINDITYDKKITFSTIDLPLLAGVKLFDLKIINMRLVAGPKVRFNAGSLSEFKDPNGNILPGIEDQFRKASFGLETGVGIELFNLLNVDVRYNLIQNITKDIRLNNVGEEIKNSAYDPLNTFLVSLGIVF